MKAGVVLSAFRRLRRHADTGASDAATATEIVAAVRVMIDSETARVDNPITGVPGGDPGDMAGWHVINSLGQVDAGPGRPVFDPEAWRWFRLVDLAVLDCTVLVEFTWNEPGSPDLHYLTLSPVGRYPRFTADEAAYAIRSHLRVLLAPLDALPSAPSNSAPGWRNRAHRTWINHNLVVVANPHEQSDQAELDRAWHQPSPVDESVDDDHPVNPPVL